MYDGYLLWQLCGLEEAQKNFCRCQQSSLSVYCSMYVGSDKSIPAVSVDAPSTVCRACIKVTSSAFWSVRRPFREITGPDHLLPVHHCCPPAFRLPSVLYTCLSQIPSLMPQASFTIISGSAWHSPVCHSASHLSFLQMLVGSIVHRCEQGTGAAAQCRRAPVVAL